jgi:hypothetical protein
VRQPLELLLFDAWYFLSNLLDEKYEQKTAIQFVKMTRFNSIDIRTNKSASTGTSHG